MSYITLYISLNRNNSMTCGIYEIINIKNNKKYIGQSVNIEKRWGSHKRNLNLQQHDNSYLQNAWNKYGEGAFVFNIIEECSKELLNKQEMFWIAQNDSYHNGYNLDNGGGGVLKYSELHYRVVKKGIDKEGRKRYAIIKDNYSNAIVTSIFKEVLDELCILLNDGEITENDAQLSIQQHAKEYQTFKSSINQLYSLGVDYLINQSSKGYTQTNICRLHNISQSVMNQFLQEQQITWREIYKQGEQLKIQRYDEENNIQQQVINGATNKEIRDKIGCSIKSLQKYKKQHNIRKPRGVGYTTKSSTNTGVQYLTLLKDYTWQYRRTYQNPNNIERVNFEDIKQIVEQKGYLWIVHDENKLQKAIKKSKMHREIVYNKKIGKKIHKKRKYEQHKQKFAQKKALKVFRKMFKTKTSLKSQSSSTGITNVTFNKPETCWVFKKPKNTGTIKRQKLIDLKKEVEKQNYNWIIEDDALLDCVKKEVRIYKQERKKPFLERKKINFRFI